jgi:hypothetical protein
MLRSSNSVAFKVVVLVVVVVSVVVVILVEVTLDVVVVDVPDVVVVVVSVAVVLETVVVVVLGSHVRCTVLPLPMYFSPAAHPGCGLQLDSRCTGSS